MPRSKMEPGSHGEITYHDPPDGRVRGTVRFRRVDGSYGFAAWVRTRESRRCAVRIAAIADSRDLRESTRAG